MAVNYGTALSHLCLAGTGIYYWMGLRQSGFFPRGSYDIIIINSIVGVWRWGINYRNPSYGHDAAPLYKFTSFLQDILVLPCITTSLMFTYNYQMELGYAYTAASLIPFIAYVAHKSYNEMVDLIIIINCISLGAVTLLQQNYNGVAAAVSYAFAHLIRKENDNYPDIPNQDMYNYAMIFFSAFAFHAIVLD
ncbi:hypothetical protein NQ317_003143 [Molorchus minor]|uniref:Uncharacterized protein n=1 Tax=Molorchus minor TaxID=1323400 RepID=A0ABQ9JZ15_9CUCU|nr:hypothetical protein NQ317_003143 [Molorchus minor]